MALMLWIVFLLFFYRNSLDVPEERRGEQLTMLCQIEDIVGTEDNSISLICKNVYENQRFVCHKIKLYQQKDKNLFSNIRIGQIIRVQGFVYSFSTPGNPGQFNEFLYYQQQGIQYKAFIHQLTIVHQSYQYVQDSLYRLRVFILKKIQQNCNKQDAGVIAAIVLGEKSCLDEEVKQLYQENGIVHILAISGLHISMIGATFFLFLRKYVMPMHLAAIVTGIILVGYGILIGFPISATRAIVMMICQLGARFIGKHYDAYCALALSAWIQLLLFPLSLLQTGFLLSYGTVFGILLFVKEWQEVMKQRKILSAISASMGVQMVTLPILLYFYYEISTYGIIVNVVVIPLLGVLLGTGIVGISLSFICLKLGKFFMGTVHSILLLFQWLCQFFICFPHHQIILGCPSIFQIAAYYFLLLVWVGKKKYLKKTKLGCFLPIILAILILCFPNMHCPPGIEITSLDVGQGDCTVIRTSKKTILIDGGSSDVKEVGKYRMIPFLKYHGINQIDVCFFTHSDEDHVNGLRELLKENQQKEIKLGKVVLPRIEKQEKGLKEIVEMCRQENVPVQYMKKGDSISIDNMKLQCLHPYPLYQWKTENDYSLVLKLTYNSFSGLFTGDLEEEGEKELIANIGKVDYLKVSHHGSKGANSEAFLQKIQPEIAVCSVGENNRYGHPHKEVIERLKKLGTRVFRTDSSGAITVVIGKKGNYAVKEYRSRH